MEGLCNKYLVYINILHIKNENDLFQISLIQSPVPVSKR
jgi:hypothetical protein